MFRASHTFLVTGATSGIGRSIATHLLSLGASVIASGRDVQRLSSLEGERCHPAARDLGLDQAAIPEWVASLARKHGPLSGIVHSAGVLGLNPLRVIDHAYLRRVLELNLYAFLMLAKGLAQDGVHADEASLLGMSSVSSLRGLSGSLAYSASKGALNAAVLSLASELAPLKIRCNAILPGLVQTEMTDSVEDEQLEWMLDRQFLPGRIQPQDVAELAAMLLSEQGRFLTGQLVMIDAGSGQKPGPQPYSKGAA